MANCISNHSPSATPAGHYSTVTSVYSVGPIRTDVSVADGQSEVDLSADKQDRAAECQPGEAVVGDAAVIETAIVGEREGTVAGRHRGVRR